MVSARIRRSQSLHTLSIDSVELCVSSRHALQWKRKSYVGANHWLTVGHRTPPYLECYETVKSIALSCRMARLAAVVQSMIMLCPSLSRRSCLRDDDNKGAVA